mmetsp:Transcript_3850/g.15251  ORF Transcript_3850/g.15251 Transcript_3850/m.15251 type:complete len:496 (+) Transcript_3850:160-1647(+)
MFLFEALGDVMAARRRLEAPALNPTKTALQGGGKVLRDVGAGAEIYVLAQNFLLYIALVIITALLQHYYFPDSIKRGQIKAADAVSADDDAEDGGAPTTSGAVAVAEKEPFVSGSGDSSSPPASSLKKPGAARRSSSLSMLAGMEDFDQETSTKREVLTRLSVCVTGLLLSFLVWGVLQERMLTKPYGGDYFTSSYGLVFLNRLGGFIISGALLYTFDPVPPNTIAYRFAFPSVSNMLSSWCQYEALRYVSFPTQMLFKCFKLFPIMVMGTLLGTKVYPLYDYCVAIAIGIGIVVFLVSTEDLDIGVDSIGEVETIGGTICGIILLLFFLVFDSFTGQYQARLFNEHPELSAYHMMFMVNTFSMIFSFITLVHTHELVDACTFVYAHADMHIHLIVFSIASTVGQLFIFKTIKAFGPVIFAIAMNTRIILSITLSALVYGHHISTSGVFGLAIVFTAITYRIKRKTEGKQLIKWAGMNEQRSMEVFHEWHEHCDM